MGCSQGVWALAWLGELLRDGWEERCFWVEVKARKDGDYAMPKRLDALSESFKLFDPVDERGVPVPVSRINFGCYVCGDTREPISEDGNWALCPGCGTC